mmetsp:Transcript_130398/g.417172  ORF Transcript_130398/g.417172 Transcript_130398/m.417172 type:complete len:222 (+) Transcript_130398:1233-1898(+)
MPFIMPAVCCCCRDCFSISVFQSFMSVACACSASLSTAMSPRKHKIWEESSVTAAKRPARSSSNAPCNMSTVSTDGPLRAASSKRRMTSRSSSSILSKAVLSRVLTSRKNMLYHCARSTTVRSPLPSPSAGAPGAGDALLRTQTPALHCRSLLLLLRLLRLLLASSPPRPPPPHHPCHAIVFTVDSSLSSLFCPNSSRMRLMSCNFVRFIKCHFNWASLGV